MSDSPQHPGRMSDREFLFGAPPPPVVHSNARASQGGPDPKSRVAAPAIALAVIGGLALASGLINIAQSVNNYLNPAAFAAQMEELKQQLDEDSQFIDVIDQVIALSTSPITIILNVIGFLAGVPTLLGGLQMYKLRHWPLAITGAITAMLPIGSCFCVGLPIGIWALVVLLNQDVRQAFKTSSAPL